jgi:hypothetical protein
MEMHEFKYLIKKGVEGVTTTALNKWIVKYYKNYQECEYEGICMVMSLTTYCKIKCVCMRMQQHKYTNKAGLKKEDSDELRADWPCLCPNTELSCW